MPKSNEGTIEVARKGEVYREHEEGENFSMGGRIIKVTP